MQLSSKLSNKWRRKRRQTDKVWKDKKNKLAREWHDKNKEYANARQKEWRRIRKYAVLAHYSNGEPHCACCNEKHLEFLTIDHIKGGGTQHRKSIRATHGGDMFYGWIIRNHYPQEFRVLCFNCNASHGLYGYCPHKGGVPCS